MKPTEHNTKTPSTTTGLSALLCALLHIKGTSTPKTSQGSATPKTGRRTATPKTGAPKTSLRLTLSVLATTLGALAFTSAPALAAGGHVFKESFNGGVGHEFSDPTGIAVNNATGDVYVVDKGNNRVEEFNPTGKEVIAEFNGQGTAGELSEPEAIAIDNSGETASEDPSVGDVYVTDHNAVNKFTATGEYRDQITEAEGVTFTPLDGVAVDPKGQVWVYQDNAQIDAFSDGTPNAFLSSRKSVFERTQPGLAVNSEDDLFVAKGGVHEIAEVNSKGEKLESGDEEGRTGVAVESTSNEVYIDKGNPEEGAPEIQVYALDGLPKYESPIETFGEAQLADHGATALAVSYANISRSDVYVVDSAAGMVDIFTPPKVIAHVFSSSFGKEGSGAGEFADPTDVAVNNETGDAYVVDKDNDRVEYFSAAGVYEGEFNGSGLNLNEGVSKPATGRFEDPESVAVDNDPSSPSYGDVYVTDNGHRVVDKFSATGEYKGQITGTCEAGNEVPPACEPSKTFIPFAALVGVAVDANGVVWVAQRSRAGQSGEIDAFSGEEPNVFLSRREPQTGGSDLPYPGFAVDSADYLYLTFERAGGEDLVAKLGSNGQALEAGTAEDFCGQPLGQRTGVAVDLSSDDVLLDYGSSIGECAASGSPVEAFGSGHLTGGSGLGVSASSGAVYVADSGANDVNIFDLDLLPQVAVGAGSALTPSSVTLEGQVTPEGRMVSSCDFEYGTSTSYGKTAPCETEHGEPIGEGTKAVPVTAKLSGLSSGTTYHYRLVAGSAIGTNRSADYEAKTLGPEISAEEFDYVEVTNATLQATIDPNGSATSYHFEYDTRPYTEGEGPHGTSLPVPNASLGAGKSPVPVSVKAQGLQPGTTYYYRVLVESELQGVPHLFYGPSKTFTTPTAPGSGSSQNCTNEQHRGEQPYGLTLPDCRAYEMVSPLETVGQDATDAEASEVPRASVSGEAVTYASKGAFANPTGEVVESQMVSRRGSGGWSTQDVTPLHDAYRTETYGSYERSIFTPELTAGVASTNDALKEGAPGGGQETYGLYVANFAGDSYEYVGEGFRAVAASTDLSRVVFGEGEKVSEWFDGQVVPVAVTNEGEPINATVGSAEEAWHAVSSSGSRVYFSRGAVLYVRENAEQPQSPLASPEVSGIGTLTKGSDEVTGLIATSGNLNNAAGGGLRAGSTIYPVDTSIGKFQVGQQVSGPGIAPGTEITQLSDYCYGGYGGETACLTLSIPTTETIGSGAQIYFSGPEPFEVGQKITGNGIPAGTTITAAVKGKLTLSEPATTSASGEGLYAGGGCTVAADACTVEVPSVGATGARYWDASADGTKVFFTRKGDLYQYSLPIGQTVGQTTALTEAGEVQGVVQISEDGSYVYFVAKGALKGEHGEALRNASGAEPVAEADNLYLSHDGGTKFIATLAANDSSAWERGPAANAAVVTPSGTRLAFVSERSLTGYDNEQAQKGECEGQVLGGISAGEGETGSCREIYLYDAETNSLACASCDPTGARPVGSSSLGEDVSSEATYRPRNLVEDGALFFDSFDALVPHTSDGRQNVYEYEDGHVYAISDVAGGYESFFLDASASGNDVFFGTADQLLPEDTSNNVAVWDARVGGGFPVTVAPPPCDNGDACKPPPAPQPAAFGLPGSATFSGPGNIAVAAAPATVAPKLKTAAELKAEKLAKALKACKNDKSKKKRATCEKSARKYGVTKAKNAKKSKAAKKAKKASDDRRASR